ARYPRPLRRRQPTLSRRRRLDRPQRRPLARPPRRVRALELRMAAVRPLGQARRLGPALRALPGARPRVAPPRLHERTSASARRGCPKKGAPPERVAEREALGRSRGGLTTKVHVACDALGNPVRLLVTAGQRGDVTQAAALLEG